MYLTGALNIAKGSAAHIMSQCVPLTGPFAPLPLPGPTALLMQLPVRPFPHGLLPPAVPPIGRRRCALPAASWHCAEDD